jgi:hypothetical protein
MPGSLPSASISACIGAVYAEAMSVRAAFGYFFFGCSTTVEPGNAFAN